MRRTGTVSNLGIWLLCASLLTACSPSASGGAADRPTEFEVPVQVRNASDVGSLRLELTHDPEVLKVRDVGGGDLSPTAMVEFYTDSPGRVVIGIVDVEGIHGDVVAAAVTFTILQMGTPSHLTIDNVLAYDSQEVRELPSSSSPGEFGGHADSVTFPVLVFVS